MSPFITLLSVLITYSSLTLAGFGPPMSRDEILQSLYGKPCDCREGYRATTPTKTTRVVDCSAYTAYLTYEGDYGSIKQGWQCVQKPKVIPLSSGRPGPCPSDCRMATQMHSTCYKTVQQCTLDGKTYLTSILEKTYSGSLGGENDYSHSGSIGHSKFGQANCVGTVGKPVCWPPRAPVHISDGGGPSDILREAEVQRKLKS